MISKVILSSLFVVGFSAVANEGKMKHPKEAAMKACVAKEVGLTADQEKALTECHTEARGTASEAEAEGMGHGTGHGWHHNPAMKDCLAKKGIALPAPEKWKAAFKTCHGKMGGAEKAAN
jgi:hypothetical protein